MPRVSEDGELSLTHLRTVTVLRIAVHMLFARFTHREATIGYFTSVIA